MLNSYLSVLVCLLVVTSLILLHCTEHANAQATCKAGETLLSSNNGVWTEVNAKSYSFRATKFQIQQQTINMELSSMTGDSLKPESYSISLETSYQLKEGVPANMMLGSSLKCSVKTSKLTDMDDKDKNNICAQRIDSYKNSQFSIRFFAKWDGKDCSQANFDNLNNGDVYFLQPHAYYTKTQCDTFVLSDKWWKVVSDNATMWVRFSNSARDNSMIYGNFESVLTYGDQSANYNGLFELNSDFSTFVSKRVNCKDTNGKLCNDLPNVSYMMRNFLGSFESADDCSYWKLQNFNGKFVISTEKPVNPNISLPAVSYSTNQKRGNSDNSSSTTHFSLLISIMIIIALLSL